MRTGIPDENLLGFRYAPHDGADLVASLAADLIVTDLQPEEILSALSRSEKLGVRGGRVHDYLHAVAAEKSFADKLWTFNLSDFQGLTHLAVESPGYPRNRVDGWMLMVE